MSSRRSRLFNYLRFWFFTNFLVSFILLCWFVFLRVQRSRLLDIVERQLAYNVKLSSDLAYANNILTNYYFSAASSFVSNIVSSSTSSLPVVSSLPVAVSSSPASLELPDLSFRCYFEVGGVPYIKLRNQSYKRGDIVLGYPIEDISPDVVVYRGKFYKVVENEK